MRPADRVVGRRRRDEQGTGMLLIIGLAVVLLMLVGVVTDASAAYLQRQGLDSLADGAALSAADAGSSSEDTYAVGVGGDLRLDEAAARAEVVGYLHDVGAYASYPDLTADVSVDPDGHRVTVVVHAAIHLPFRVPGSPSHPHIGAASSAAVGVDDGGTS